MQSRAVMLAAQTQRLLDSPRLGPRDRLLIALEVLVTYVRVRTLMLRRGLPAVVEALRRGAPDHRDGDSAVRLGVRLGSPVLRTLDPLPWDSRCLMRSLVLLAMLARRGITCSIVIGVRPGSAFEAHAWVECEGVPVLPALGFDQLTSI